MLKKASIFCSNATFLKKKKLDHAGCYLCSYLILSLPSLKKCTGITIARQIATDSEAHLRRNINKGRNTKSARQVIWLKAGKDYCGGLKGAKASLILRLKNQARP